MTIIVVFVSRLPKVSSLLTMFTSSETIISFRIHHIALKVTNKTCYIGRWCLIDIYLKIFHFFFFNSHLVARSSYSNDKSILSNNSPFCVQIFSLLFLKICESTMRCLMDENHHVYELKALRSGDSTMFVHKYVHTIFWKCKYQIKIVLLSGNMQK